MRRFRLGIARTSSVQMKSTTSKRGRQFPSCLHIVKGCHRRGVGGGQGECMRTVKRFTPDLLDRYRDEGRGRGCYQRYIPWHRVSRSDPSSRGRSHLMVWRHRQRELLSDGEWVAALFATMVPDVNDLREQYPLSLMSARDELGVYDVRLGKLDQPGTLEIAERLGIRHPLVTGNGRSAPWVMSTDLLLTIEEPHRGLRLLAVSCKPTGGENSRRAREKLRIEQAYWASRGVDWLLITPSLYEESVGLTLRNSMPWALGDAVDERAIEIAADVAHRNEGLPLVLCLHELRARLGTDLDLAQRAFWQSVWSYRLTLDLRRGWRPHLPTAVLSRPAFLSLNPIASGRSAWT